MGPRFRASLPPATLLALAAALPAVAGAATSPGSNGRIAFQTATGDNDIVTIEPSGAGAQNLTASSLIEGAASYSGDGERIAFQAAIVMAPR